MKPKQPTISMPADTAYQAAWLSTLDALRLIDLCHENRNRPEDIKFWRKFAIESIRHARAMRHACRRANKHYLALSLRPGNQPSMKKPIYTEAL